VVKVLVILSYDIKEVKKRTRVLDKVHKTCRKYLYKKQFSYFYGELSKPLYNELIKELLSIIDVDKDSIIVVKIPNKNNAETVFFGQNKEVINIISGVDE
jgi:CRISPR-associated endonuclease Cas2